MRFEVDDDFLGVEEESLRKRRIEEARPMTHARTLVGPTTPLEGIYDESVSDLDSPRELLLGLDSAQRQAVVSTAPLLAVIAGAGSGKTGVLTRRVAYRIRTEGTDPRHVVVLTFTRQAATELRRRLRSLNRRSADVATPNDAPTDVAPIEDVTAGTFHSVAYSLLRQYWDDHGRRHPTVIQDRRRLIGEVLGPRNSADLNTIAVEIDWARARNLSPDRYAAARRDAGRRSLASTTDVSRVLADITALKRKRGVIDLDDLLSLSLETLATDPAFAASTRWRLRHFYVDEAQDLNPLQAALLDAWRDGREDLTLVGDPAQAIFGFNGADPRLLTDLETKFPGIEVVRLSTNYRCTPQIVRAGLATLAHASTPLPALVSARPDGVPVEIFGFDDEIAEARGIAQLVASLHNRAWRDIAVLARTNAQLPAIAAALESSGIPARLVTSQTHDPLRRVLREVEDLPGPARLAAWSTDVWSDPGTTTFDDDSMELVSAESASDDETADIRRRVARAVEEFLADGGGDGRAFGAWVRANRPFDGDVPTDAVELVTFHSAKGREWDHVVVAGCETGLFPHSSAKTPVEVDEEIRLAYVALTRAADRLVLTYARSRRGRKRDRSPLLEGTNHRDEPSPPDTSLREEFRRRRSELFVVDPVWEELLKWRETAGRAAQVPPRTLCPDDVLRRIATAEPLSETELAAIPGVGPMMARRVGPRILEAVNRGRRGADVLD